MQKELNQLPLSTVPSCIALISKLDEYIALLDNAVSMAHAHAHGWRCPKRIIDKGAELRAEIRKLRAAV